MTLLGVPASPPHARSGTQRRALVVGHLLCAAVVVAGVAAQLVRPLAPDLGPAVDPGVFFDAAFLARVDAYRGPLRVASLVALVLRIAVPAAVAFAPPGRRLVDRLVARVGAQRPALASGAVAVAVVVLTDLVLLPLAFWAGYVHEGVWGFRTQGLAGWVRDWLVGHAPGWLAAAVLVTGGVWLVRRLPRAWPPVAVLVGAALAALLVFVSPLVIEPLSYRLTPLADGPVRAEVQRILGRADERVEAILVADASRRTTKENAYVSGLGATRRVVLYDTLVANRTPAEIGVVLAHELGHDRNGDLVRLTLLSAAGVVTVVYAVAALLRWRARGTARRGPPTLGPRTVATVLAAVALLQVVSLPLQTWVSRCAEAAADFAALELTQDPETFLAMQTALARANLSDPSPPGWARLLWSTHPSSTARLTMGVRWVEEARVGSRAPTGGSIEQARVGSRASVGS